MQDARFRAGDWVYVAPSREWFCATETSQFFMRKGRIQSAYRGLSSFSYNLSNEILKSFFASDIQCYETELEALNFSYLEAKKSIAFAGKKVSLYEDMLTNFILPRIEREKNKQKY